MKIPLTAGLAILLSLIFLWASLTHTQTETQTSTALDLLVSRDGIYSVPYEDLRSPGVSPTGLDSLQLSNAGTPVPYWVEGDEDGRLGPGDRLSFVGRHLPGMNGYYNEYSDRNVYSIRTGQGTSRGVEGSPEITAGPPNARVRQHLEENRLRVRFNNRRIDPDTEVWYWQRLNVLDRQPFEIAIDLETQRKPGSAHPLTLTIDLRGWSFSPPRMELSDHALEVLWNGEAVARTEWDAQDAHRLSVTLAGAQIRPGENRLQLQVPARRQGPEDDLVVDVSLLNWIRLEYPFEGLVSLESSELIGDPETGMRLPALNRKAQFYTPDGKRYRFPPDVEGFTLPAANAMLASSEPLAVEDIRVDRPSDWKNSAHQADYLIIAHGSLLPAIRPLAAYHKAHGLTVAEIDVQDLYDEFNAGIQSPQAIKEFIAHAYHHWARPAPRFVLLVGDASWDTHTGVHADRNYADWTSGMERGRQWFVKNGSTPYAEQGQDRNLVPTLHMATFEGYAASDTALVAVDGDDWLPDLAVGRLPVVTPGEVRGIVEKLLAYAEQAGRPAPWRRNLLLITNDQARMQKKSDRISLQNRDVGLAPIRIYPEAEERDNARHQSRLIEAFDQGQLLVHFLGHGGRYIWRTGPPDLKKNHDLFTLDHVDQLAPTHNLPLVLSMACYSAPFDHPVADSIGEKLLRVPDKGAVGVLAASWRNTPSQRFSIDLIHELSRPGSTVGEAIMRAKHRNPSRLLVETYNYFGDPASRLQLPQRVLKTRVSRGAKEKSLVAEAEFGDLEGLDAGEALLELIDDRDRVIAEWTGAIQQGSLRHRWPLDESVWETARFLRIYAWNDATGKDAIGAAALPSPSS